MSNNLIVGYTKNDESRGDIGKLFPFVDILAADGTAYTSFGSEPFTPNNELRYNTFQLQDNLTRFSNRHSLTFGVDGAALRVGERVLPAAARAPTSTTRWRTSTPTRTATSPTRTARRRRSRCAGSRCATTTSPARRSRSSRWRSGTAAPTRRTSGGRAANLTVTAGLRFDVPAFKNTAYDNPNADALDLPRRDRRGGPVPTAASCRTRTSSGRRASASTGTWAARQTHAGARRHRRLHRPAALCLDFQPDRQHGRAHRLRPVRQRRPTGRSTRIRTATSRPT